MIDAPTPNITMAFSDRYAVVTPIQVLNVSSYIDVINIVVSISIAGLTQAQAFQGVTFSVTGPGQARIAIPPYLPPFTSTATWQPLLQGFTGTLTIFGVSPSAGVADMVLTASVGTTTYATEYFTVVSVAMQKNMRAANTPQSMADRIPPREATPFQVSVTPDMSESQFYLTFATQVSNQVGGGNPGTLTNLPISLAYSATLYVVGGQQSDPGCNLLFTAKYNDQIVTYTQPFYVAAIPTGMIMWAPILLEGFEFQANGDPVFAWGAKYPMTVLSDSGVATDLDRVSAGERLVLQGNATGVFDGQPATVDGGLGAAKK